MKLLLATLILIPTVSAHQPRIVNQIYATETVPIHVEEPEISKAYYGDLKGAPEYYRVVSKEPFRLYVGVLVPAINGADTNVSAQVLKDFTNGEILHELKAEEADWDEWYEEHAGDTYRTGPELSTGMSMSHPRGVEMEEGTYYIKVFSPDNNGKYVLAIGDQEAFPFSEIVKTILTLPKLKVYFGKTPLAAFTTPTSLMFLAIALVPIVLVGGGVYWWWRRVKR